MSIVTVAQLLPHLRELVWVPSSATLDEIRSLMTLKEIARVPVIDGGGRTLRGIVRMRSFFRRTVREAEPRELADVLEKSLLVVTTSTPLFEAIAKLDGAKEVLVRESDAGKYTHILTSRGVASWLGPYSARFLVLEELEITLRACLKPFEGERLAQIVSERPAHLPPPTTVDRLHPGDYQRLCVALREKIPAFARIDPDVFGPLLRRFAERRNQLMHFRVDNTADFDSDLEDFRKLQRWLAETSEGSA